MSIYSPYINGQFKETSQKRDVIDPSTGEVFAQAGLASREDVEEALIAARLAFDYGEWPRLPLSERKIYIQKICDGILAKAGELAALETRNTGKPIKESTFMDIPSAARTFRHFADHLEEYVKPEILNVENAQSTLLREPRGVVVLIVPWNYPLLIASWKLASALAAGNTVILKPSSLTPLTVLELAKILHAAGLPKGVVNIVNADGSLMSETLCKDSRVDMISFTGSNEVGKKIIENSAASAKKLILELGGKSASIVCKDADLELAVNGALCSAFLNGGQMCTQMSRIFVDESIYDDFVGEFVAKAKRIKVGPGADYETQIGPLVSRAQQERCKDFVDKAKQEGARVLCGGGIPRHNGFYFEPTVLAGVTNKMGIFHEEVFGPVVCIGTFSSVDDAVMQVNDSDFGLAAALWSLDTKNAPAIASRLNVGTVWINTYGMFYPELPYGGCKQSGFGKELGREGFLEYTRLKNIFLDRTQGAKPLVNYWYGLSHGGV
ncbi:MAG TPA: aldehyde dehydrogenase family protein [Candidatus Omnitrophota bacterium]|nr:aldehyde dehydrogenase family protein [Candidatus Omnitrophota bacterium]HPT07054.1 aldehyde dehydrogenase family protein [Candidatus Omnitrophota bacterium]